METKNTQHVEALDAMLNRIRNIRSSAYTLMQDATTFSAISDEQSVDRYRTLAQTTLEQLTKLTIQVQQNAELFTSISQLSVPSITLVDSVQNRVADTEKASEEKIVESKEVYGLVNERIKKGFESWRREKQLQRSQPPIASGSEEDQIMQEASHDNAKTSDQSTHPVREKLESSIIPSLISRARQAKVDIDVNYINGVIGLSQGIQLKVNDTFVAVLDIDLKNDLLTLNRIIVRETAKDRSTWEESPWSAFRTMTINATLVADQLAMDYPQLVVVYFLDWLVSHHDLLVRPCHKCHKLFCFDSPADKFLPPVARYPLVAVDEHGVEISAENDIYSSSFHRQAYHLTCL